MRGVFEITEAWFCDAGTGVLVLERFRHWALARGAWRLQTAIADDEHAVASLLRQSGFKREGLCLRSFHCEMGTLNAALFGVCLRPLPVSTPSPDPLRCVGRSRGSKVTIRPLGSADALLYFRFRRRVLRETPFLVRTPREIWKTPEEAQRDIEPRSRNAQVADFIAEANGGTIVGAISAAAGVLPRSFQDVGFHMGVLRGFHRQGIGLSLLRAAEDWARARGKGRLTADVLANNRPALAFYRNAGFLAEGRRVGACRLGNGFVDEVVMAKFLV